jgi:hypothetical protein
MAKAGLGGKRQRGFFYNNYIYGEHTHPGVKCGMVAEIVVLPSPCRSILFSHSSCAVILVGLSIRISKRTTNWQEYIWNVCYLVLVLTSLVE